MKPVTTSKRLLLLTVSLALLLGACTQATIADESPAASPLPPLDPGREPFAAVAERVLPSVVNVTTNVYQASPTGQPEQG